LIARDPKTSAMIVAETNIDEPRFLPALLLIAFWIE